MKNSNSKKTTKGGKNVTKNAATQQVKNTAASTTRRVLETRDAWEVIFNHSVSLLASYAKGIKVEKPREGFEKAFGSAASSPNSRAYAKSLIWGFATNRAGKVLKNLDDVATPAQREKIAKAILVDCKLVRNGSNEDINAQLARVETKREKAIAEAVLAELTKAEKKSTTKGGKGGKKSESKKATTPKGGSSTAETKKDTPKGVKKSAKKAA